MSVPMPLYAYCRDFGPFHDCASGPGPLWVWIVGCLLFFALVVILRIWLDR